MVIGCHPALQAEAAQERGFIPRKQLPAAFMDGGGVRVVSRRMVRPLTPPPPMANGNGCHPPKAEVEVIHLTPWDLRLISIDYIQKGILLPRPPVSGASLVNALQSSFARALRLFYPFAGRLAAEELGDGTVSVFLRCTGEGAEFVHAVAPGVAAADIVSSLYTPPVVWEFYPLARVLGADAAIGPLPVLAVQVTELADGVFFGMTLNHSVGDGTAFWHFFNTWSEIHRAGGDLRGGLSTPPPVLQRWFHETCPVPIPMPFRKLEHIVKRFERTAVQECFFTFSGASVRKLKARANGEMAMAGTADAAISSLQAVLAHLWRAVCRARRLPPEQGTFYSVVVGCRGRVGGIPPGYVGNAMVFGRAAATAGEIEEKGLGWTAWLLNRAVASFDEASMRESLERWVREPDFTYVGNLSSGGTALVTGSSPRFDVFGNDFGWGKPVAIRSGAGNKVDGKATVFEGPERGGSMSLEVCIAPDALARLVADEEFMDAVSMPGLLTAVRH
ncbi:uncharacterized acetyltransferase At3g50280-like [Panicum virgatum]|uniref:Acetyltransferase n=1 Tax=Panicum virgatum TaxID=38727 RepID=A0A8T0R842_PANVG|nr:uncharacterized acetyltransferase At3g50280-like [Panicum virgatum]KAG2581103.1 hypothetical protein PVAP13_6KG013700 [Panicum virgatum]